MRKSLVLTVLFLSLPFIFAHSSDWRIAKSTHFIVYYKNAPKDFLEKLISKSEDYYNTIAENLGFRRYNFWLWDNRAKIYVYDDVEDYQSATGHPVWSQGAVIPKEKTIHVFPYADWFFEIILPHELGHIIFREFVGFDNTAIPIWLDEGVASYQEKFRRPMADRLVRKAMNEKRFIGLEWLSNIRPHSIKEPEIVELFYAESISVVDYLIKEFGRERFFFFCRALRDKKNFEEAMASIYRFKNIKELDSSWQKYLKK